MKAKCFLRGFGIGIVMTALLLCITYRSEEKDRSIIREAKELGMVFPERETQSVEETAEHLLKKEEDVSVVSPSAVEVSEETEKEKKTKEKLDARKKDIKKASKYHGENRTFIVREGLLSSSVSREMEEAGIIEDGDELDRYLQKNGYEKMVRSGKYKIPADADIAQIAKIITRQD